MMRVDPSLLSDAELEFLVDLAASPAGRRFRKLMQGWLGAATAKYIDHGTERMGGYVQGLSDICGILDRGGEEMRHRRDSSHDTGAEYWKDNG